MRADRVGAINIAARASMLSGHDPGKKGSMTPLKAKVMKAEKLPECWLTCGVCRRPPVGCPLILIH